MNTVQSWKTVVDQLISERDSLRQQNIELWRIVRNLQEQLDMANIQLHRMSSAIPAENQENQSSHVENDQDQSRMSYATVVSSEKHDSNLQLSQQLYNLLATLSPVEEVSEESEVYSSLVENSRNSSKSVELLDTLKQDRKSFSGVNPPPPIVNDTLASEKVVSMDQKDCESGITTPRKSFSNENQTSLNLISSPLVEDSIEKITPPERKVSLLSLRDKSSSDTILNQPNLKQQIDENSVPLSLDHRVNVLLRCQKLSAQVISSMVRLNDSKKEYLIYIISVKGNNTEKWRIQKKYSDFLTLHESLRRMLPSSLFSRIGKSPSREIFNNSTLSPSKNDKRFLSLESFLNNVLKETLTQSFSEPILRFLCTDVSNFLAESTKFMSSFIKEGYLTKRGKRIGGWLQRYFVLSIGRLEYFESHEHAVSSITGNGTRQGLFTSGNHPLGIIHLQGARLLKHRSSNVNLADENSREKVPNEYRNVIIIKESLSHTGSEKIHMLYAESDVARDEWLYALSFCIAKSDTSKNHNPQSSAKPIPSLPPPPSSEPPVLVSVSKMSSDTNLSEIHETSGAPTAKSSSKLFDWLGSRKSTSVNSDVTNTKSLKGNVFGVSLKKAVQFSKANDGYELPSVVFRCIEYLDHHKAYLEEGIYRLSGRSSLIRTLKDQFDRDGDVELMKNPSKYDVHSIAGLLKLYLRELPDSLLTNELHNEFLHITDFADRSDKLIELARLVSLLPIETYTLLRTLVSHLITIVQHSDVNKMTTRNVGIVFSPTLSIPAGIFTLMMAEFEFVFWVNGGQRPRSQKTHKEPSSNQRLSWLPDQVQVANRNNRNSKIFEDNAPDVIKAYEDIMIQQRENVTNLEAEKEMVEFDDQDDIDLYDDHSRKDEESDKLEISIQEGEPNPVTSAPQAMPILDNHRTSNTFSLIDMYDRENRKSFFVSRAVPVSPGEEMSQMDSAVAISSLAKVQSVEKFDVAQLEFEDDIETEEEYSETEYDSSY